MDLNDNRAQALVFRGTPTAGEICSHFEGHPYIAYHAPRFAMVLELLQRFVTPDARILDVGRTVLTEMISAFFKRPIDSLGFEPDAAVGEARHYHFDLNLAQHREKWRADLPAYDIIILAEVLEHLYTAPSLVLAFLRSILRPGGILVVQTPNGTAIGRRLTLLSGKNPYERIREDPTNPGHFREYTLQELKDYGANAGLTVVEAEYGHWIDCTRKFELLGKPSQGRPILKEKTFIYRLHEVGLTNVLYRFLPPNLRSGITIVYRRDDQGV